MKSSAASGSSAAAASALDCSIVMIAHNRARQLPASLAALARQAARAPRFELILVNDGSTDGTGRLARAYRAPFPYRYLERENTNCRAAARNLALQHARGKVILFLDAECIAPAGLVASHVQRHARGCQAIAGGIRVLAEPVSPALVARDPALLRLLPQLQKPYLPLPERGRAPGFITAHASCRREDAFRIGFFDESFTGYGGEDLDFGERLALAGVEVTAAGGAGRVSPAAPDRRRPRRRSRRRAAAPAAEALARLENPPCARSARRSVAGAGRPALAPLASAEAIPDGGRRDGSRRRRAARARHPPGATRGRGRAREKCGPGACPHRAGGRGGAVESTRASPYSRSADGCLHAAEAPRLRGLRRPSELGTPPIEHNVWRRYRLSELGTPRIERYARRRPGPSQLGALRAGRRPGRFQARGAGLHLHLPQPGGGCGP